MEVLVLIAAGVAARVCGSMVRGPEHWIGIRLLGWAVCALGVWLMAAAAGAWFPIWPALLIGLAGGAAQALLERRQPVMALTDVVVFVTAGIFSIPPVPLGLLLPLSAVVVAVGALIDQLPRLTPRALRLATFGSPFALAITTAIVVLLRTDAGLGSAWYRTSGAGALSVAVSPPLRSERIELETAQGTAVAWLDLPPSRFRNAPYAAALVFHGDHPAGSRQPTALALRRALLHAGYLVLSLDHQGFGDTPRPKDLLDVERWDPDPAVLAALAHLRAQPDIESILAVGHSMGCMEVMRALGSDTPPDAAVLFGMAVFDPPITDDHWRRRFHRSHQLPPETIPLEVTAAIRKRYYDTESLIARLDESSRPALTFVRFGIEHENLLTGREKVRAMLGEGVAVWDMESTHYLNTTGRLGIVAGDVRTTRAVAAHLRGLRPAATVLARHEEE